MVVALRGTPEMCQVNPSRITVILSGPRNPGTDKANI